MALENLVGYLVALAVPLWLVGEYAVHSWKSAATRRAALAGEQLRARRASKVSHAAVSKLADYRGPA